MIRIVFTRERSLGSLAIRAFTASRWSHVALVTGAGTIIDATFKHGVAERPWSDFLEKASAYEVVTFAAAKPDDVVNFARTQVGKKYDMLALVGFYFRTGWQDTRSWFCSELIAWAINRGHKPTFREKCVGRITPQHLWLLAPAN